MTVNSALSHLNLFNMKPYFFKKHFNIIPLSTLGLPSGFIPASFLTKILYEFLYPPFMTHAPFISQIQFLVHAGKSSFSLFHEADSNSENIALND